MSEQMRANKNKGHMAVKHCAYNKNSNAGGGVESAMWVATNGRLGREKSPCRACHGNIVLVVVSVRHCEECSGEHERAAHPRARGGERLHADGPRDDAGERRLGQPDDAEQQRRNVL